MLKALICICVLSCAAMQTAPEKTASQSSRQLYEQASKAIASTDPRAAIGPLEQLIQDQPTSPLACVAAVHLAECYVATERSNDAVTLLEKWSDRITKTIHPVALDSNLAAQHLRVWLQASKRIKDDTAAIHSLETLLETLLARQLEKTHSTESADQAANTNDPLAETLAEVRIELARRLTASGKFESAAAQIAELTDEACAAVSPEVQLLHAMVFQQVGDHERSRKALQVLIATAPQTPSHLLARLELATYAVQEREHETAAALLKPIIDAAAETRGFDDSLNCRFRLLWSELELAQGHAERSLEVLPSNEQLKQLDSTQQIAVRFSRAEAASQTGRNTLALDELNWLNEQASQSPEEPNWATTVMLRRCELLLKTKRYSDLAVEVAKAKERFANYGRLHELDHLLARAAVLQVDFEQARFHLQTILDSPATKNSSAAARAQWMLGETYFLEENWGKAIEAYSPVAELSDFPTWQTLALMQTAKCRELLKQSSEALNAYQKVVAITRDEKIRQEAAARIEVIERIANSPKSKPLR